MVSLISMHILEISEILSCDYVLNIGQIYNSM